jgi:MFS family permease
VFVVLVGSNLVTPLFPLYAEVYGLSPLGVSLLFATYALLIIPALLIFGPLSDVKGRRELLTGAIILAAIAAGLFAAAHALVVLFAAQAAQAMALGALQGTAAPTLIEQDPSEDRRRASAVASAMTVGGAVAGPLVAGCLIPSFVTLTLKGNLALAGGVVAFMLGCATIVQLAGYRLESPRAQTIGPTVMVPGLLA